MCATTDVRKQFWNHPLVTFSFMIGLGIFCGLSGVSYLQNLGLFIAAVFIKIFKCLSLPLIALSIIVTLSQYRSDILMKSLGRRTLLYTLSTTLIAAMVSCLLYLIIKPTSVQAWSQTIAPLAKGNNYFSYISSLFPSNMITPFIDQQVITVLFMSVIIGIALKFIKEDKPRETLIAFFHGTHGLFMVVTQWVIKLIPIALFGFMTTTTLQVQKGHNILGIGAYLLIIVMANLIQGFIVLPFFLKAHGIRPLTAFRGMLPALSIAFFSKSSVGTLPITIKTIEQNLNVNQTTSRFVLPLCTSINMNGCAAFIFATVIYLMQNHGIVITLPTMFLWIIIATIAAIGNAGVPMGCFFLSASLLASMNIPITLMGIILPFYSLIDMLETALNVWSDSCVTLTVDKHSQLACELSKRSQIA